MDSVLEAYEHVMEVIADLERDGIKVTKVPSGGRQNKDTVAKYSGPDRLPVENWYHVTLHTETPEQAQQIHKARRGLIWKGIIFDSGGMPGYRDWEIDWSFKVKDTPDSDHEAATDAVEDLINGQNNGP